jgi:hypothetical protein
MTAQNIKYIHPLTLLVGHNSSVQTSPPTTQLAAAAAVHHCYDARMHDLLNCICASDG